MMASPQQPYVRSLGPRRFLPHLMTFGHMEAPAESFVAQFERHAVQEVYYVHMEAHVESFVAQFERHAVQDGLYVLIKAPAESFSRHMDGVGTG